MLGRRAVLGPRYEPVPAFSLKHPTIPTHELA